MGTHGFGLLVGVHCSQSFREPRADDDDVALFELDAFFLGYRLKLFDCDSVGIEGVIFDALSICPGFVVDENASANEAAAVVPVCIGVSYAERFALFRNPRFNVGKDFVLSSFPNSWINSSTFGLWPL